MKPTKSHEFKKTLSKNQSPIISELVFSILIFLIMILIIANPSKYSSGTIAGLNLFITNVMPGLFPFMLLTKLLTELGFVFKLAKRCDPFTKKVFGTPGVSLYAFVMSILSGYPIGAKIISDLYEKQLISQNDAKKMSIFCTTSGPIFIIGAVGLGMFDEYKIGAILYISHILSSIILGISYNLLSKNKSKPFDHSTSAQIETHSSGNILANCIAQTINSIFLVGAYITIFYLVAELLDSLNILTTISDVVYFITKNFGISQHQCQSLIYGLLEVTRGCKLLSSNYNTLSIVLCCGLISFSGFSIIMQSMSFLKNTKIKMHSFVFGKLAHSILSIFICFILLIIFM